MTIAWQSGTLWQGGIERPALDREGVAFADPSLPRDSFHTLEQFLKGAGREAPGEDLDPFGVAGADVGARKYVRAARKQDAAGFGTDVFRPHPSQLVPQNALDAE